MAMASPTPLGSSHFNQLDRRPSSRQALRKPTTRPHLDRRDALPPSAPTFAKGHARQYSLNDSSDDELPMPMTFSALTNALLAGEVSIIPRSPPKEAKVESGGSPPWIEDPRHIRDSSAGLGEASTTRRTNSSEISADSPFPRRIVRLSGTPVSGSMRRATSLSNAAKRYNEQSITREGSPRIISTPAPLPRTVRIPISSSLKYGLSGGSSGNVSSGTHSAQSREDGQAFPEDPATVARHHVVGSHGSVSRYCTLGRTRYGDDTGMQGSMRVKRVGKIAGNFLSGPARRGRRRQSEEDREPEPEPEHEENHDQTPSSQEPQSQDLEVEKAISSQESQVYQSSLHEHQYKSFGQEGPDRKYVDEKEPNGMSAYSDSKSEEPHVLEAPKPRSSTKVHAVPVFRVSVPPDLPSAHDQENEAPPTFRRNKPMPISLADKMKKVGARPQSRDLSVLRAKVSPERKALTSRSQNTPHRPAPPPPKMSVLETATVAAGAAATSHASKKRNAIRLNGKSFTRLDVIGRGGSSKVWRVMAENGKFLALKRVSLEDADEGTVRGFKGEIDLLKKLEGNDRVVRLLDYEMNEGKQTLSVLMEMGELDFNKILTLRFNSENAKFDPSFTRHYWKEMLECIQAVHDYDIVHSDLKPANFVLVQGRLKLIDFGIANAIQTDETVNVHRDHQIGTPNYMSPESLMDCNDLPHNKGQRLDQPKVMKLGKPSDIWSLGCILYQMSYGRQPFAHIQNQMSRCRAIIDWNYAIEFPSRGVGGAPLPKSLIRTMKKCLTRDQHERPTVGQLLDEGDPFLYPIECSEDSIPMTEELLGRILQSVAAKCKERVPTEAELLSIWPAGYFASLRKTA